MVDYQGEHMPYNARQITRKDCLVCSIYNDILYLVIVPTDALGYNCRICDYFQDTLNENM